MPRAFWVFPALACAALAAVVGAYFYFHPTYTYHYRLTLDVEMPDGSARSGSTVVADSTWRTPSWMIPPNYVQDSVTGEATVVDLGDGRLLVALLTRRTRPTDVPGQGRRGWGEKSPGSVLLRAYGVRGRGWEGGRNELLSHLSRQRGAREIEPGDLPDLVTFEEASDPRSVKEVDPRDLAASFGPGVRLRRAAIEVTGDPVTEDAIERALPWLRGMRTNLTGATVTFVETLANRLTPLDFKRKGL